MSCTDANLLNYDFCICMGRFQPFHWGHFQLVKAALDRGRQVLILLGSHLAAPSLKNPWSSAEREQMICECLEPEWRQRIQYVPISDRETDEQWLAAIHQQVLDITGKEASIAIIGHHEQGCVYFFEQFSQWDYIEQKRFEGITATDIRAAYFSRSPEKEYYDTLPSGTQNYLKSFKNKPLYQQLCQEYSKTLNIKAFRDSEGNIVKGKG